MRREHKKPLKGIIMGFITLGAVAWTILNTSPDSWLIECAVLLMMFISLFFLFSWILKNRKTGFSISAGAIIILILNRLEILDLLTAALTIIVLGLVMFI